MSTPRFSAAACGLVLAACAFLLGCPDIESSGPSASCHKAYDKCVLPNGVLGICDAAQGPGDEAAPRLVCRSQH